MRATPVPEFMLEPAFDPAGSGRDAVGLGSAAAKGLDVRHGTILTLEGINVSFDGFRAITTLADNIDLFIAIEQAAYPRARQRLIVHDQQADRLHARYGMVMVTSVPRSGAASSVNSCSLP